MIRETPTTLVSKLYHALLKGNKMKPAKLKKPRVLNGPSETGQGNETDQQQTASDQPLEVKSCDVNDVLDR